MFSLMNINRSIFLKALLGTALINYLLLSLAGTVLHNHPHHFSLLLKQANTFLQHDSHGCDNHGNQSSQHKPHHHACPVCHLKTVILGAVFLVSITLMISMLCVSLIVLRNNIFPSVQNYYRFYLRAPPVFS